MKPISRRPTWVASTVLDEQQARALKKYVRQKKTTVAAVLREGAMSLMTLRPFNSTYYGVVDGDIGSVAPNKTGSDVQMYDPPLANKKKRQRELLRVAAKPVKPVRS